LGFGVAATPPVAENSSAFQLRRGVAAAFQRSFLKSIFTAKERKARKGAEFNHE